MEQSTEDIDRKIWEILNRKKWEWEPDTRVVYPLRPCSRHKCDPLDYSLSLTLEDHLEPGWRLQDIILTSRLLTNSSVQQDYSDEAEMRRVFGLVYDVLRYREILDQALNNVGFWQRYGHLKDREKLVWLLLYDMHGRKFSRVDNNSVIAMRNAAFKEAGLLDVENALIDMKIRVAAGVSRLRIGGSALSLDNLLPGHLGKSEGGIWRQETSIASGWVNSAKIRNKRQFIEEMAKLGLTLCLGCLSTIELEEHQYVFDPLCPKVVNLHEKAREKLAVSQLVRNHCFVFLERSLCLGAATLLQAFKIGKLSGPVILTHSLAPRHTGYLAELLVDVEDAGRLLVFGVGDSHAYHQLYLHQLGIPMQRCKVFAESYTSGMTSPEIERASVILATPLCTYTGVRDIIDLAIARGGDLKFLESLTNRQAESDPSQQPQAFVLEQTSILKCALAKPNVQLVIYEVHTLLACETVNVIEQAVHQVNQMMLNTFQRDPAQRKKSPIKESSLKKSTSDKSLKLTESIVKFQDKSKCNMEIENEVIFDEKSELFKIKKADLFEVSYVNDVFNKDCTKMINQDTFIAIFKRKEAVRINSQFTVKAESKKISDDSIKQIEQLQNFKQSISTEGPNTNRKRRKPNKVQFERITAPTHASMVRRKLERHPCPRHQQHIVKEETSLEKQVREARRRDAHRWWDEVAHAWRTTSTHAQDYRFQALRTDPLTRKILFPSHIVHITYPQKHPLSFAVS